MEKQTITLDEQKKIELQIMDYIVEYCEKNNLKYYLAGGTLLGAVRHKGFIPWDDDIDITMPREDYEKLLAHFNEDCDGPYKLICHKNTDGYHLSFAKITDTRTVMVEQAAAFCNMIEYGVYIDIFPLDFCPDSRWKIKLAWRRINFLSQLLFCKRLKNKDRQKWYSKIFFTLLKIPSLFVSEKYILKKKDQIAMQWDNLDNPKKIAALIVMTYGWGEVHDVDWYGYGTKLLFEGRMYSVPKNYDAILTGLYGDYMTPPPPEKRVAPHTADVYWKD